MKMNPSPFQANPDISPPRFIRIIPAKPRMQPASFFQVIFSMRNTRVVRIITTNAPEPFIIEDFTPVQLASPR